MDKKARAIPVKEKRYEVCDSDGLYLLIAPSGRKSWLYRQQSRKNGAKACKKILGTFPEMSLYEARHARDELRQRQVRREQSGLFFAELAEDWFDKKYRLKVTEKTQLKQLSRLRRYVFPYIGETPADEIKARDVLWLVRKVEEFSYTDVSRDVCQLIGMILRYGVAIGACERDVTQDLRGALAPSQEKHRATITNPLKIGEIMRAIHALPESSVKWAMLTVAYCFLRSGEVRLAKWTEIDFDRNIWSIPAERMKMRRPHLIPLSSQVVGILQKARLCCGGSEYVFPTPRTKERPLSDMAMLATLRRIGYAKDEMSMHGFRSMASTRLNEAGWPVDAIELQLAHMEENAVRAAYNYAQRLDVRQTMLQWYANYLDALRDGTPVPEKP
ncbi:MAG: tyrosine-type recombinase/integrase [Pyramidobacter sp.]|nr:tyrosine-type recombinase/integrase [Pyramidobacter sp.]